MSGRPLIVLKTLAAGGQRANDLASVICRLVKDGAELGALEDREVIGIEGHRRTIQVLPREWLERLSTAVELGAFKRMSVEKIVERILAPPLPAHVES